MSGNSGGDGSDEKEEHKSTSEDNGKSSISEGDSPGHNSLEQESLFDGVEDVDRSRETSKGVDQPNQVAPENAPGAHALKELAEGESLTQVLDVALKEWREVKEISQERDEIEFEYRKSIIRIGAFAFLIVIFVSGLLTYTGDLPGSSFAFILGTLFGSLASLLQTFLQKHQPVD